MPGRVHIPRIAESAPCHTRPFPESPETITTRSCSEPCRAQHRRGAAISSLNLRPQPCPVVGPATTVVVPGNHPDLGLSGRGIQGDKPLDQPQWNHPIPGAREVHLRNRSQSLPIIGRIERAGQRGDAVVSSPGAVVQISGRCHQALHIGSPRGQQGGHRPATGVTHQGDPFCVKTPLEQIQCRACCLDHHRSKTSGRPVGLGTSAGLGINILAGSGQVGHVAAWMRKRHLQPDRVERGGIT